MKKNVSIFQIKSLKKTSLSKGINFIIMAKKLAFHKYGILHLFETRWKLNFTGTLSFT